MKFALPLVLGLAVLTSACDTIENRRSFYAPKKADGPYTRSLEDGSWEEQKSVDQQYSEARRLRAQQGQQKAPEVTPITQPTEGL